MRTFVHSTLVKYSSSGFQEDVQGCYRLGETCTVELLAQGFVAPTGFEGIHMAWVLSG